MSNRIRNEIVSTYSRWCCLSALRSGAPIKSRESVYRVIQRVDFEPLSSVTFGAIDDQSFDNWHERTISDMLADEKLLNVGWAAKIINVYLKTWCYVGGFGRPGLSRAIHPPIDAGLWKGIRERFTNEPSVLSLTHTVTKIKDIQNYELYARIISGCRLAVARLNCDLIEIEQLWQGTRIGS